jgi:hypothetical protein
MLYRLLLRLEVLRLVIEIWRKRNINGNFSGDWLTGQFSDLGGHEQHRMELSRSTKLVNFSDQIARAIGTMVHAQKASRARLMTAYG